MVLFDNKNPNKSRREATASIPDLITVTLDIGSKQTSDNKLSKVEKLASTDFKTFEHELLSNLSLGPSKLN